MKGLTYERRKIIMQMPIFEKYIDGLIEKSTLDVPAWNIEKAREGKDFTHF